MTKKEMFERLLELVNEYGIEDKDEVVQKLEDEIERLSKKKTVSKEELEAKEALKQRVLDGIKSMEQTEVTVTEVYNELRDEVDELTSSQKVSAVMQQLLKDNKIRVSSQDKRTNRYSVV